MYRFTPSSRHVIDDCWNRRRFGNEHAQYVFAFVEDMEAGDSDRYRYEQLQASTDQWAYFLPPAGLVVIVDRYPRDGGWLLDIVNVFHDDDLADSDPWALP